MVQNDPTPFQVGRAFVHQYYTLLHQAPNLLYRFYSNDSTFIHGGVDRPESVEKPAVGPDDIARRIEALNLRDCHAKIRQVDSHPTIGHGVVVQVTGELSNNGDPMRRFMQTFVLAPRQPKKYYVQNDIFRYQDEVFNDGSDDDDQSSSQNDVDQDKISNADSSAARPEQPLLVIAPRTKPEESYQPLPPRNVGNQQQTTINQSKQQEDTTERKNLNGSSPSNEQQEANRENQIQPKSQQVSNATASYARIASIQLSNSVPSNTIHPPTSQPNVPRVSPAKSSETKIDYQSRGPNAPYSANHRNQQWNENVPRGAHSRRPGSHPLSANGDHQVFVGSIPSDFTEPDLIECFEQFGKVRKAKIHCPQSDHKKNFGFVVFEDPEIAANVVKQEHVTHKNVRLNVEPKTQKGIQGSGRNSNYQPRAMGGSNNRGGGRSSYRGNNSRRGGGGNSAQYRNNSPSIVPIDENFKDQIQQQQQQQQ